MQAGIWWLEDRFLLLPMPCQEDKGADSSEESQAGLGPDFWFLKFLHGTKGGSAAKTEPAFLAQHMGESPEWEGRRRRAEEW